MITNTRIRPIETERLVLRAMTYDDAADVLAFAGDRDNPPCRCTLFVPRGSDSAYRADGRFACFKEIKEEEGGHVQELLLNPCKISVLPG